MPGRVDYRRRFERVVRYIYDHLDEDLDLNRLAEIACLSSYHWHRVYHALTGETVAATVRRLRLQRAAAELSYSEQPIADIARRCGYPSLPSFTRTFKAAYGMPPARYRRQGSHTRFDRQHPEETVMHEVNITELDTIDVFGLDHRGSYMTIGQTFNKLFGELGAQNLLASDGDGLRMIGIYYDDPNAVAEAELRSLAAVALPAGASAAAPLRGVTINAGSYAVLCHQGPYSDMQPAYNWLFGEWLVGSGRTPADAPAFEEYLNDPQSTPPTELLTAIHMPLSR